MRASSRWLRATATVAVATAITLPAAALAGCGRQPEAEQEQQGQEERADKAEEVEPDTGRVADKATKVSHISSAFSGDGEIAIAFVNGSWLHSDAAIGSYVWVADPSTGAHYRVSLDGIDYAVAWDAKPGEGKVEHHESPDAKMGRRVVVHLPADEYERFDGEFAAAPSEDEGSDSALERIAELEGGRAAAEGDSGDKGDGDK